MKNFKSFTDLAKAITINEASTDTDPMVSVPGLYSMKMSQAKNIIKELAADFNRNAQAEDWEKMRYFLKINKLDPYLKVVK